MQDRQRHLWIESLVTRGQTADTRGQTRFALVTVLTNRPGASEQLGS